MLAGLAAARAGVRAGQIYYGETATLEEAETLARKVRETAPGVRAWRSSTAASRTTGTCLRRVSERRQAAAPGERQPLAPAQPAVAAPATLDEILASPVGAVGHPAGRRRCGATRGGWGSRPCATCCSTSRAGTTTCASCCRLADVRDLDDGSVASAQVSVLDISVQQTLRRRVQVATARLADGTGFATATWFGRRYIEKRVKPGDVLLLSGRIKHFGTAT